MRAEVKEFGKMMDYQDVEKKLVQLLTSSLILIGVSWYDEKQKTRKSV